MKKFILKVLSIILILCMALPVSPLTVYASDQARKQSQDGSDLVRQKWLDYLANKQANETGGNGQMLTTTPSAYPTTAESVYQTKTLKATNFSSKAKLAAEPAAVSLQADSKSSNVSSRYTVLVLDRSGSMSGTPLAALKAAAQKFCASVVSANGNNNIAIVTYDYNAYTLTNFTNDYSTLENDIDSISDGGNTNLNDGLLYADNLLSTIQDGPGIIKNVVLLSDGLPNEGSSSDTGRYTYDDYYYYSYANEAYNTASTLKSKGDFIYTLGFFHDLNGDELTFARRFMNDLQNAGYYDVVDPDNLQFVFGDIANTITKQTGTFRYAAPTGENTDYSATYYYDEGYFSKPAIDYNSNLATMSLCFELSAWGSNEDGDDYSNKSKNAKDLLGQLGFEDYETGPIDSNTGNSYFTEKPDEDSIACVAAHKDIVANGKKYTLIALATRGGGYEAEWAGNFTIGKDGQHEGFKHASDLVYEFLSYYIEKHKSEFNSDIKLWLAGYSRGGATVNLLAGRLDNEQQIAGLNLNQNDMYAYCFEPPMGALLSDVNGSNNIKYDNIHNIVNPTDVVTKVAPRYFGFYRYGNDYQLPAAEFTSKYGNLAADMLKKYKALDTKDTQNTVVTDSNNIEHHIVDTFQAKTLSASLFGGIKIKDDNKGMSTFLDGLIGTFAKSIGSRDFYVDNLQDSVRYLSATFMGNNSVEKAKWDDFAKIFPQKIKDNMFDIVKAYILDGESGVEKLVNKYADESFAEAKIDSSIYPGLESSLKPALNVAVKTLIGSYKQNKFDDILTIAYNYDKIFPAHFPELCLAWLESQDNNYTPGGSADFIINSYRIVHINCPVNVAVYDSSNSLVASIINDVPQNIDGSSIISSLNGDGEKVVYLPADEDYNIKITATGDGTLSYSINEFSYESDDISKIVNFYDVPISLGDVLYAAVPKYSASDINNGTGNGTSTLYSLSKNGNEITPDATELGNAAAAANYSVSVESNNPNAGSVSGAGERTLGSYAQVNAIPNEGYKFVGWYEGDNLVSDSDNYRFCVKKDTSLVAKFTANSYALTLDSSSGGSISTVTSPAYETGSIINLAAKPNVGYHFVNWTSSNGGIFSDANSESTTFTMPYNATTVKANFEVSKYALTLTAGTGGTIKSVAEAAYASGDKINLEAIPDSGYRFKNWAATNGGTFADINSASTTFTMPNNAATVEAYFENIGSGSNGGSNNSSAPSQTTSSNGASSQTTSSNGVSWSDIQNKITNAKDGDTITVDMKDETSLPIAIINSIKDKNITIVLNFGAYTWTINGKSVGNVSTSCDLKVSKITDSKLSSLAHDKDIAILQLTYNGDFPFTANLKWNVGLAQNNKPVYISSYNETKNRLEYQTKADVDANGNVSLNFNKGIKYVLTSAIVEGMNINKKIDSGSNLFSLVPFLIENDKSTIVKWSSIVGDSIIFKAPKEGSYEYRDNKKVFNDISEHWAGNAIDFITARELFSGIGNGKFDPDGNMTRAMFATVLARLDNADLTKYNTSTFTDVDINTWYGTSVAWAADKGIINGYSDKLFGPNDLITREQMAVMINNYMKYKGITLNAADNSAKFDDNDKISSWAKDAVANMLKFDLIKGVGNNIYAPKNTASRASVAQVLMNFINAVVEK